MEAKIYAKVLIEKYCNRLIPDAIFANAKYRDVDALAKEMALLCAEELIVNCPEYKEYYTIVKTEIENL